MIEHISKTAKREKAEEADRNARVAKYAAWEEKQRQDKAPSAQPAEVAKSEKLTPLQAKTLAHCEKQIDEGFPTFLRVGECLLTIQEQRLHRETHATFEAYFKERYGMGKAHAYRLISGAEIARAIREKSPIGDKLQPQAESQIRPLAGLPKKEAKRAWKRAVKSANGSQPTAKQVQEAVKPKPEPVAREIKRCEACGQEIK